jgi:hypothetical protein
MRKVKLRNHKPMPEIPLKIMVASTIYGFQDQLEQVCATLTGYGYEVWNSHMRTIPVNPGMSNPQNCLRAVQDCDLFFGIIRPRYGAVIEGDISITHQEIRRAIELRKPRWFIGHRDITVARQLLKQYMLDADGNPIAGFSYRRTDIMDDIRVINLYNEAIMNNLDPADRVGHWVDEFYKIGDVLRCIETQFSNLDRVREIVNQMNQENE